MTEQRLLDEILEGIRALRQSDTETKVKLEGITVQLQNMTSMRLDFELAQREIVDHGNRLGALEKQNLDSRLKKVEGIAFKIIAGSLMILGAIELANKVLVAWRVLRP